MCTEELHTYTVADINETWPSCILTLTITGWNACTVLAEGKKDVATKGHVRTLVFHTQN